MKLYTKTGDDGTTGLIGGRRVDKFDLRIEAYGTVDELNAVLGVAAVAGEGWLVDLLGEVQSDLFAIGSHLAAADGETANLKLPAVPDPAPLEHQIDAAETELEPLTSFILPGGSEAAARLHLARCVCRRAERLVTELSKREPVAKPILVYLNRLSDWLFVQARVANSRTNVPDLPWTTA